MGAPVYKNSTEFEKSITDLAEKEAAVLVDRVRKSGMHLNSEDIYTIMKAVYEEAFKSGARWMFGGEVPSQT